jgi:GNAT superfamily N-acetyltransferase
MAVERETGHFDFAGGSSADYRDILALPTYRRDVVEALIAAYRGGGFRNVLSVGWIDEASDTPALLADVCRSAGLDHASRTHACWRWWPAPGEKPHGQRFLNRYLRQADVRFCRVASVEEWQRFRFPFFVQHSLRQLQAGRPMSMHDPQRQSFFDELFASPEAGAHVLALYVGDTLVAGHFGNVWRGVLHFGAPSFSLEEETRSPAVALLCWALQRRADLDFDAFDLTIGDTDFKRRLGNRRFELTTVDVYPDRASFLKVRTTRLAVESVKSVVVRVAGESAWKARVLPAAEQAGFAVRRVRERGLLRSAALGVEAIAHRVHERRVGLVYTVRPGQEVAHAPKLSAGESWEVHDNCPEDLLAWRGDSVGTAAIIGQVARNYGRARAAQRTLHTVMVDGRLAGWGFSYLPEAQAELTETPGVTLQFEPGAASLYDFHTIPEFRGRKLYQALLGEIVRRRFAEGVPVAYITVLEKNAASRVAIERAGFTLRRRTIYRTICSGRIHTIDPRVSNR